MPVTIKLACLAIVTALLSLPTIAPAQAGVFAPAAVGGGNKANIATPLAEPVHSRRYKRYKRYKRHRRWRRRGWRRRHYRRRYYPRYYGYSYYRRYYPYYYRYGHRPYYYGRRGFHLHLRF